MRLSFCGVSANGRIPSPMSGCTTATGLGVDGSVRGAGSSNGGVGRLIAEHSLCFLLDGSPTSTTLIVEKYNITQKHESGPVRSSPDGDYIRPTATLEIDQTCNDSTIKTPSNPHRSCQIIRVSSRKLFMLMPHKPLFSRASPSCLPQDLGTPNAGMATQTARKLKLK